MPEVKPIHIDTDGVAHRNKYCAKLGEIETSRGFSFDANENPEDVLSEEVETCSNCWHTN